MLGNIGNLLATGIIIVAIWLLTERSPYRVIRKIMTRTPIDHMPEGFLGLFFTYLFDAVSWITVVIPVLIAIRKVFDLFSAAPI